MEHIILKEDAAAGNGTSSQPLDQQTQIYILSGVFGGVCLILLICVFSLMSSVSKLQKQLKGPKNAKGQGNEAAELDEVASRFAQYPPLRPQLDRPQSAVYQNLPDKPYVPMPGPSTSRYEAGPSQPNYGRSYGVEDVNMQPAGRPLTNRLAQGPPPPQQQQQQQQPRGLRNYDNFGY